MHLAEIGGPGQHVKPWLAELAREGPLEVTAPKNGSVLTAFAPFSTTTALRYRALTFPRSAPALASLVFQLAGEVIMFFRHIRRTQPDLVIVVTSVVPSALVAA